VLVQEPVEGSDVGELIGVDQIGGEHQSSRRVMSKNHVDP